MYDECCRTWNGVIPGFLVSFFGVYEAVYETTGIVPTVASAIRNIT